MPDARLIQNKPNPFREFTTIGYQVSRPVNVSLSIYDISGRQVKSLADKQQGKGSYRVSWDGKDESGVEVAKGLYFYRLASGGFTTTGKLVVLR